MCATLFATQESLVSTFAEGEYQEPSQMDRASHGLPCHIEASIGMNTRPPDGCDYSFVLFI